MTITKAIRIPLADAELCECREELYNHLPSPDRPCVAPHSSSSGLNGKQQTVDRPHPAGTIQLSENSGQSSDHRTVETPVIRGQWTR